MPDRPSIEFRTGIGDKLQYANRWLRVAARQGARVRVVGPARSLSALSQLLWTSDREDFLPHAWSVQDSALPGIARTAIWLGEGAVAGSPPSHWLNIGDDLPADLAGCDRLVELVATTPEEVSAGRQRWAGYRRLGLDPRHLGSGGDEGSSA